MNRTQKAALGNLVVMLLSVAMLAFVFFRLFILKKTPEGFAGRFLPPILLILLIVLLLAWILRRQSPKEVDADERDKLITNRAAMAVFVSAWIVFPVVSVIPRFIFGDEGCIPAWSLPLINVGALLIVMAIYSTAVLVQYGWGGKDGGK